MVGWISRSLRHTYATMRIAEGVSVFQLAANMGTSVEMLDPSPTSALRHTGT